MKNIVWMSMLATGLCVTVLGCREDIQSPTAPEDTPALAATSAGALAFRQVSASANNTCGVTTDDLAYCWGRVPVSVIGGRHFLQVRAGIGFACGLATDNRAYCWGDNAFGQLGDGTNTPHSTPVAVAGGRRFRLLRTGGGHACALTAFDVAFCWGRNGNGQLGDGTTTDRRSPVPVNGGLRWHQLGAGNTHTCGVSTERRAYCWGLNSEGQLGDGTNIQRLQPVAVVGRLTFSQVSAGLAHSCGVTLDNLAYCWGRNRLGQLGDGSFYKRRQRPVAVAGRLHFSVVSPGGGHTCGVTTGGLAYCWGWDYYGSLGDGATLHNNTVHRTPVAVVGGLQFLVVSAGAAHTCGVTRNDRAFCWGQNVSGQLGDGTREDRSTPVAVVGPM